MANLPFLWQTVVVVLTVAGLLYLLFLGITIYFDKKPVAHEVIWDENLEEGQAPVPSWWFWSGIAAAIFALLYMAFYPSFGNYKGLFENALNVERYAESKASIDHDYYRELEALKQEDIATLQSNDDAMKLAKNTFAQNCAVCHTSNAKGQTNFPNLTDHAWIWGGSSDQITRSIAFGRKALMPPWGSALGEEGVDNVARYVKSIADNTYNEGDHAAGKAIFQQSCVGCHGANLQGNPALGAPNLGDSAWIYGGDLDVIKQTIKFGRNGVMPAHKDRLTPLQIKLLVAWLSRNKEDSTPSPASTPASTVTKKVSAAPVVVEKIANSTDQVDGKAAYVAGGCAACHGAAGKSSVPIYPKLAGQKSAYIVKQLKDFQSGARKDPTMSAMAAMAAGKEQAIADWLATQ